jgi:molecular chaperone HtpG
MTSRLTESPACIVAEEGGITPHMARLMEQMGQSMPKVKPVLELNPDHSLVKRVADIESEVQVKDWALFLFEQAQLAEGDQLASPADFIKRVNKLLMTGV